MTMTVGLLSSTTTTTMPNGNSHHHENDAGSGEEAVVAKAVENGTVHHCGDGDGDGAGLMENGGKTELKQESKCGFGFGTVTHDVCISDN